VRRLGTQSLTKKSIQADLIGIAPEVRDDIFLPIHDTEFEPVETDALMPWAEDFTPEQYNEYLTGKLLLPNMGTITKAKVISQK
jgi:hypothetical protein